MRRRLPILSLLLALAASACAASPQYLRAGAVDPVRLLPAPPAETDPESLAELEIILAVQARRTPGEVARAAAEALVTPEAFRAAIGPWFAPEGLPLLNALLQRVLADTLPLIETAKRHFSRPRPAAADARIGPAVPPTHSPAYPSGHAAIGMAYAVVLADLLPDRREAILHRGREIGWDRVIAGVHHPSDVVAGRVLGQAVATALLADPRFVEDQAPVRAELEAACRGALVPAGAR